MVRIEEVIWSLSLMIDQSGFKGFDPYDALNNPLLLWFARRNKWAGVAFTQGLRFLPINLRPLLGIPRMSNAKTMALLARAYLRLYDLHHSDSDEQRARLCLEWLLQHRSPGYTNACWGYSFPWCTVRQFLERDAPSVVCTSFVAHAFLDAFELWREPRFLVSARSACDFILSDCPRIVDGPTYCFSYTPFGDLPAHNANVLGASVLGRVYAKTGESDLLEAALTALDYTLKDQNEDGSWYYHGPYPGRDGIIDNFHTGFVLDCLRQLQTDTGTDVSEAVENGQQFYEEAFFAQDGTPSRKVGRSHPVDIRDAAELLVVMGRLQEPTSGQRRLAEQVLEWTVRNMRYHDSYFYFLRWRNWAYSPMYLRWQAWMLWGLASIQPLLDSTETGSC